jgi:hypothetical protein
MAKAKRTKNHSTDLNTSHWHSIRRKTRFRHKDHLRILKADKDGFIKVSEVLPGQPDCRYTFFLTEKPDERFPLNSIAIPDPAYVDETYLYAGQIMWERGELFKKLAIIVREIEQNPDHSISPNGELTMTTWSQDTIKAAYEIGRTLSDKTTLRRLAGFTRKGQPKRTADVIEKAREIRKQHHREIWSARRLYKFHRHEGLSARAAMEKLAEAHPEMPHRIFKDSLSTEPAILAREWTIQDLDLRGPDGKSLSADRLKAILNTKADTNGSQSQ